ncbi:hypothetical protein [Paraburkholderia ultramafica]|uniref:hypothetical protein n=1 Tax=Paraburkholderia ultramafica TaxID=1544867 RepID=UPI001FE28E68|nr:hypothetical protein [Paraburkholderia ultramafica]
MPTRRVYRYFMSDALPLCTCDAGFAHPLALQDNDMFYSTMYRHAGTQEIAMFIYSIRYRDVCGRWSVAFIQAASQSDAEAIATRRYGAFHSASRTGSQAA